MLRFTFQGTIPVVFFREDGMIVAYSSALDLSTCGKTIKEAQKNFTECLKIYLEETIKHGTLEKDLLRLGWKRDPKEFGMIPPIEKHKTIPVHILKITDIRIPANA